MSASSILSCFSTFTHGRYRKYVSDAVNLSSSL